MKTYIYEITCPECEGKKKYTILNAYDSKFKQEIKCEYCGGTGKVLKEIEGVNTDEGNN